MPADPTVLAKVPQIYFDGWNGRDAHALDDLFATQFHWTDPLLPEALTSIEGEQFFMTATWGGLPDASFELNGGPMFDEANGRVGQQWKFTGTLTGEFNGIPPTNKSCEVIGVDVFEINSEGRIIAGGANYDSLGMLRQLGLA